jgi:divalent metal cation (Fe/Co/Zn/Cd) transporter
MQCSVAQRRGLPDGVIGMLLNIKGNRGLKQRQAGMTTLGLIILVAFVGLFAFAGIRLTPVYLNYMKVVGVIDGVLDEFDGTGATRSAIRNSIGRRFDIESVSEITASDIKVSKVDGGHEVAATYSHKAPFIANVSFVVDFDKRVLVRR